MVTFSKLFLLQNGTLSTSVAHRYKKLSTLKNGPVFWPTLYIYVNTQVYYDADDWPIYLQRHWKQRLRRQLQLQKLRQRQGQMLPQSQLPSQKPLRLCQVGLIISLLMHS